MEYFLLLRNGIENLDLQEFEVSRQHGPELDAAAGSDDLSSLPFWIQALEEEASQISD
jgi:hypothetical protein